MRKILSPTRVAEEILGLQEAGAGEYRLTTLCIEVPVREGVLRYHTLTGALFLMEKGEKEEDHQADWIRNWFLVPAEFRENELVPKVRDVARALATESAVTSFTVMTTMDCNARCYYCYEAGRARKTMTERTAHDTAAYIARVSKGKPVRLQWFGGEPLLNSDAIRIITGDLRAMSVPFRSTMTSNGSLLDRETAKEAAGQWNLEKVQITLDGMKERYLKAKAYTDRDPEVYERVLQNIDGALSEGIEVTVRLNASKDNVSDLMDLVDELGGRFGGRKGFSVYASPLLGTVQEEPFRKTFGELTGKLKANGFLKLTPIKRTFRTFTCMADNPGHEVITPDGNITRCEHVSETDVVGSIYSDDRDEAVIQSWQEETEPSEACPTCPLLPECNRLKKCDWVKQGCDRNRQKRKTETMAARVKEAYLTAVNKDGANERKTKS